MSENEVMDAGKLLTFDEFRILLSVCGLREIDGIYMPEKNFSREEIVKALHHMTEKGMIAAEGDEFVIQEELQAILRVIKEAQDSFSWELSEEGPGYYCYVSESGVVVSEMFWKKKDTLKLRWFSRDAFDTWKEQIERDYRGD